MRKKVCFLLVAFIWNNLNAQTFEWALSESGVGDNAGNGMVLDSYGNMYVIGSCDASVDIDPGPATFFPPVGTKGFIQKLDSMGNLVWAKCYKAAGQAVVLDSGGNIYTAGNFFLSCSFETGDPAAISVGGLDVYIQKLDPSGNQIWLKTFGGSSDDYVSDIRLDEDFNLTLVGGFRNTVDFDPGPGINNISSAGVNDVFTLKIDSAGNFIWAKSIGGINDDEGISIETDLFNNVYVSGGFLGTVNFDPGISDTTLVTTPSWMSDGYIIKYDASGNFIWVKQIASVNGNDVADYLSANSLGELYVIGTVNGDSCDFDPGPGSFFIDGSSPPGALVYVMKLDTAGSLLWAKQHQGLGGNSYTGVCTLDPDENLFLFGYYDGDMDFDPGPGLDLVSSPISGTYFQPFVQKIDANGNFYDAKPFNVTTASSNWGYCGEIKVDSQQNIFTTGYFDGTTDFDPGPAVYTLTSAGTTADLFLVKLNQDYCSNYLLVIDSVTNTSCFGTGIGIVHSINGSGNSAYTWNTSPVTLDSIAHFSSGGIFTIMAVDTMGCFSSKKILVNGPSTMTDFDLDVNLVAGTFTPGAMVTMFLDGNNLGCDTVSGDLKIVLDSSVTYSSSIPSPSLISGNTLTWHFNPMNFDSAHFTPQLFISIDTSVSIGDVLCFNTIIQPIVGDADTSNNNKSYCFPVSASFDPNCKQVYPQGVCIPKYILSNESITYTIYFQNTGTSEAISIFVLDTLDPALDLTTLSVISSSHYMYTEILPGNVLKFVFNDIHLPDSTSDEPHSHGYLIYNINPISTVSNGTIVNNSADIYFDYNPPVSTNTVYSTLIDTIPYYSLTQNVNISCGSSYTFPDGTTMAGIMLPLSYTSHLVPLFNCDSSITTIITIDSVIGTLQNVNLNCGDDFTFPGGSLQTNIVANIIHVDTLASVFSCDSIITTNITVNPLNTAVTQSSFTLTAASTGTAYQWLDCNNSNLLIAGETGQVFTATSDGDYAVIITNGSCSDTSACYNITGTGISNLNKQNAISIYPNPTNSSITISTSTIAQKIYLKDIFGRTIKTLQPNSTKINLDMHELESGIYFVLVISKGVEKCTRIVKN